MSENLFPVPSDFPRPGTLDNAGYEKMYRESVENPEKFWGEQAERIHWFKKWDTVLEQDFAKGKHEWFLGGKLNASYTCVDRHLDTLGDTVALLWEGDDPGVSKSLTYRQLHREVCRFANVLKKHAVQKGDRVMIYLPMILELPIAMLACARIGAVHSVVFGGFSADSLRDRILDCKANFVITADEGMRAGKAIPLKKVADDAMADTPAVKKAIVVRHTSVTAVRLLPNAPGDCAAMSRAGLPSWLTRAVYRFGALDSTFILSVMGPCWGAPVCCPLCSSLRPLGASSAPPSRTTPARVD